MSEITVGYWNRRVIAEPIRYLLHFKNVKFTDKRYEFDGSWNKDKFNLGLDFPALPYMFDGEVKLTQSITILRYLAKKFDLDGNTETEKLRVSLAEQQLIDLRTKFLVSVIPANLTECKREEYLKSVPEQLNLFSNFLGEREFIAGDYVTYVDFIAYEVFDFYVLLSKHILDGFPNLKAYQERIENLPGIKEYLHSSAYLAWPVAGPKAGWGSRGDIPK